MSSLNSVSLTGNLAKDIDMRTTPSGVVVANTTIAVNGFKEGDTSFVDLTLFAKTAEIAEKYTSKGDKVGVTGRLKQESWEDKATGQNRSKLVVIVDNLALLGSKSDSNRSSEPMKQSHALNDGKDFIVEDIDDSPIDLSEIPF